jgi:TRAP-type C4-dicarboxylate transport system permease small subunit
MSAETQKDAPVEDPTTAAVVRGFGGFAAVTLFLLMAVTVVDVTGRYVFNAPLPGSSEITELMMAVLIYAGLPAVSRLERHISVDLLDPVTPARLVRSRQVAINLVGAATLGVIAWRLWLYAEQIADYGDVTEYLHLAHAPFIYFMSVFSGLGALVTLLNVGRYLRGATTPPASSL